MKNAGGWREPGHLRRELPTWHVSRASRVALPRLPQPGDERNQFPQIPSQKIWTDKDPSRLACSEDIIPKVTRSIFCRLKGKYTSEKGCLSCLEGLADTISYHVDGEMHGASGASGASICLPRS